MEVLGRKQEIKYWIDVVWFKGDIPKHSFTMWIANYYRRPTRARLAAWDCLFPLIALSVLVFSRQGTI